MNKMNRRAGMKRPRPEEHPPREGEAALCFTELRWDELRFFYGGPAADGEHADGAVETCGDGAPTGEGTGAPNETAATGADLGQADAGTGSIEAAPVSQRLIGQRRAAEALGFGLRMKQPGYNLYVCGAPGTGRTTFSENFARELASGEPTPPDLCYVYNFQNPKCPRLITLPAGYGRKLRDAASEITERLTQELPKTFAHRDFEHRKGEIVKLYQSKRDEVIKEMTEEAKESSFGVKSTNSGIYFMPIVDGEMINEEQFEALSQEQKDAISENSEAVQKRAADAMRRIRDFEKATRKEVEELEYSTGLFTVGRHMDTFLEDFAEWPAVVDYFKAMKEDILDNMSDFSDDDADDEDGPASFLPWMAKKNPEDALTRYKVNLLTDHTDTKGAPVVVDYNPAYTNLIGEVEYDNEFGNFSTDFMKIKPGLLHRANGGYLILQAQDVLTNGHAWETLRRALLTGQIVTEPNREYATGIAVSGVKPEPIPFSAKIILVGSGWYYELLSGYDDHFDKLFRVRVDFDYEMRLTHAHLADLAAFARTFAAARGLPSLDASAIGRLAEYAARLAERQDRLSTRFGRLGEVIAEAAAWAETDGKPPRKSTERDGPDATRPSVLPERVITAAHILEAIARRDYRLSLYEEKLTEMIEEDVVMIDTDGAKVGQINGLAVIDTGDYCFAKPTRITATTYTGKAGIVNIEKEAEMSGSIHDKGIQVLIGYLGQTYAQDFPLSFSCRICFEQNYSGIDGDSASSTELYAVLSSLANLPIRQDLAVTGSINQRGEIQPIGGVTYKIEGFFDLCRSRGLTGRQGVIIPKRNVRDLVLKDEVVEAVKAGLFHIYPIGHVDEGVALLTGLPAGGGPSAGSGPSAGGAARFPMDSVHGKIYRKLRGLYRRAAKGVD